MLLLAHTGLRLRRRGRGGEDEGALVVHLLLPRLHHLLVLLGVLVELSECGLEVISLPQLALAGRPRCAGVFGKSG
jgi:hypothetical protein